MTDSKYWVAFNRIPHLGTVRFRQLEAHFGALEEAWTAREGELRAAGLDNRAINEIIANRGSISPDAEADLLNRAGVRAITWQDEDYPDRLKEIDDPPPVIYVKGEILPEDWRSIAVVGTRSATHYGKQVTSTLARDLVASGITIVSGLARGIDGIAHQEAVQSGGRTIAIMGLRAGHHLPARTRFSGSLYLQAGSLGLRAPFGSQAPSQAIPQAQPHNERHDPWHPGH